MCYFSCFSSVKNFFFHARREIEQNLFSFLLPATTLVTVLDVTENFLWNHFMMHCFSLKCLYNLLFNFREIAGEWEGMRDPTFRMGREEIVFSFPFSTITLFNLKISWQFLHVVSIFTNSTKTLSKLFS